HSCWRSDLAYISSGATCSSNSSKLRLRRPIMPETLDTQTLISELASRYGIHIDATDPAIAIVALNELVLVRTTEQISERISSEMKELEEGASKLQRRLGHVVAEEFNDHLAAVRKSLQDD